MQSVIAISTYLCINIFNNNINDQHYDDSDRNAEIPDCATDGTSKKFAVPAMFVVKLLPSRHNFDKTTMNHSAADYTHI